MCFYNKGRIATLDLNDYSKINQDHVPSLAFCDMFFLFLKTPFTLLQFHMSKNHSCLCAPLLCFCNELLVFANIISQMMDNCMKTPRLHRQYLRVGKRFVNESFDVLTSLGEESFKPLHESCAPGDDGVKHSKSPFEALGEQ